MRDFIVTETPDGPGKQAERTIVDALRTGLKGRDCVGFWHYPLVNRQRNIREPDVLLLDPEWGVVIVEVKGIVISDLESIQGYRWLLHRPYDGVRELNPHQQALGQTQAVLDRLKTQESLKQVPARAVVALPNITRKEWEAAGQTFLFSTTPLLFGDELSPAALTRTIGETMTVRRGSPMTPEVFEDLLMAFGTGGSLPPARQPTQPGHRADLLRQVQIHRRTFDLQQEKIAKSIPPGPQRIRGIAGSGKTILLAQKAANMHLLHPEWDIAVVFFCRSLYEQIRDQINHWLLVGSDQQISFALPETRRRVQVLHAWGSQDQEGFYTVLAKPLGLVPLSVGGVKDAHAGRFLSPTQGTLYCARTLLEYARDEQESLETFDAVLIDEGQDLIDEQEALKFEDRQAFYWLAYQSLRPVAAPASLFEQAPGPVFKRIIWAYDEAQSLDSLLVPTPRTLFGADSQINLKGTYPGGIQRSEIMRRCYRTPSPVLMAAHALGMGLLRPAGSIAGISRREGWEDIGYHVDGSLLNGRQVTLTRPAENAPHPLPGLTSEPLVTFTDHGTRTEELHALATRILSDLAEGGLNQRHILVVCLGKFSNDLIDATYVALRKAGIDVLVAGNRFGNTKRAGNSKAEKDLKNPNQFRLDGHVTVTGVNRAKGNEADMVYIVGLDEVGRREYDFALRNQLFVALSRSRAWVHLSGTNTPPVFREEVEAVLTAGERITFTVRRSLRQLDDEPVMEIR